MMQPRASLWPAMPTARRAAASTTPAPKSTNDQPTCSASIKLTEAVGEARAEAAAESGVGSTTASIAPTEAEARAENGVGSTEAVGEAGAGARVESANAA